jgi:hypothetical protein
MHLGFMDGPFVPHNLTSTQESPLPVLKFQMASRLKILMASGSKKELRYTFLVSVSRKVAGSLKFFKNIILPAALWPLVRLNL